MSRPAALVIVASVVGVIAGWPAPGLAQRASPGAPLAEVRQRLDREHAGRTAPDRPTPTPAGQTTEAESEQDTTQPRTPIPPVTDADRAAAFPDVEASVVRDNAVYSFVLFDQLEWQSLETAGGLGWNTKGWIGGDRNRLWFRTEGEATDGQLGDAEAHLFYGRAFSRWWDVVVGLRQDVRPAPAQTWAAFGVHGLAPYWFDVEATAYIGEGGQTAARLEAEYELLVTNRLIVQPLVEVNLYGKGNQERGIGAGLSTVETGVRVRYEFRRELAPYLGVTWNNAFAETADLAAVAGEETDGLRVVAGVRLWF